MVTIDFRDTGLWWIRCFGIRCADWSAFACNDCNGESKAIAATYALLIEALRAVAPSTMDKVQVRKIMEFIVCCKSTVANPLLACFDLNSVNVCIPCQGRYAK